MYSAVYSFSEMVQEEELNNNVFKAPSSIATPAASVEDGAERVDVNTSPEHNHIFARTKVSTAGLEVPPTRAQVG